ncbi:MAG: amidase [Deltaproteobacteria bacterium]|nr:amidase [Deltaproteobacteria bacterium]
MSEAALELDATGQADLVRRGEVTPAELVDASTARIERLNPRLNAVIHRLYDKARAQASRTDLPDGPFRGVPFLVKDVVCHTAGDPYHCGMRFLRDLGWREKTDTILAERFRAAGFVFVGKTNTPEMAFAPTTEPLAYGPTRNPWDLERSPAGSSGGAGAAVAARMVAVAHGNDMGGSIRAPASACGVVGLKPTRGRSSLGPDFGDHWWQLTHEHVLTRSVRDTAGVLDAISGMAPGDPYTAPPPSRPFTEEVGRPPGKLRIGFRVRLPGREDEAHPDCVAAVDATARLLESLGHHVEASSPQALDDPAGLGAGGVLSLVSVARELDRWRDRTGKEIGQADLETTTWAAAEIGRGVSGADFMRASDQANRLSRGLASWWADGFDVLLTPTLGDPPAPLGWLAAGDEPFVSLDRWGRFLPFTMPFNLSGQPAISLPLCWSDSGLPIGVQLVAAYAREDILLRLAAQLEEARPWRDRRPPGF